MSRPYFVRAGIASTTLLAAFATLAGCEFYPFLPGGGVGAGGDATIAGTVISTGGGFAEVLIQGRTFPNGSGATTVHYPNGLDRTPVGLDFNGDGKIDPVAGYSLGQSGVAQILLSKGDKGTVEFTSLTLDSNGRWSKLSDIAAGDIDGDGALDVLVAAGDGVAYLHNPGPGLEKNLRESGAETPDLEFLSGSTNFLTNDEVEAILTDILPPGTDLDDYDITIEQGYTNVVLGDLDNDGDNDVVASRRLRISLQPKDSANVPPIEIVAGELQAFLNPGGGTTNGQNFTLATVGRHERYAELDREGATAVMLFDLDRDGDLDLIAAAREDDNSQIAWFENPGRAQIAETQAWTQWRIGSIRGAFAIEAADLTGDGRPDVLATGTEQQQLLLFVQPVEGPEREYDWDTFPIVSFESFAPLDVKALDIDSDGRLEVIVGGTEGAVRYFETPADPTATWTGTNVLNFDPGGNVGRIGYGDLDGDGDLDLLAVVNNADQPNDIGNRLVWIRNDRP